jgi:OPA family glycerol-3-phosphate transporter-like MFS transporter
MIKKRETTLISLCCIVYFVSYITRTNYTASILEIASFMHITLSLAGIAVSGSFITYGFGQLVSGFLGDRINPRYLILIGMVATSICNAAVAALPNIHIISIVWCINGFAQAMLWPPMVRMLSENLSTKDYKKGCTYVTIGSITASIVVYLFVPVCIALGSWKWVFGLSAFLGSIIAVIWAMLSKGYSVGKPRRKEATGVQKSNSIWNLMVTAGIVPILLVCILHGILRDGIITWMPSYINDTFRLGNSVSILTGAILPLFGIFSIILGNVISKKTKTEVIAACYIWITAIFACGVLLIVYSNYMVYAILMMALITACMHGINFMLIGILPSRFARYGKVAFFSGLLNAATYVGSALSTYIVARLSETYGWKVTIITWLVIAIVGGGLCLLSSKRHNLY